MCMAVRRRWHGHGRSVQANEQHIAVNFLSFDKGNFRYVVYATDGENGRKGVVVEQSGKRIADLRCQGDAMSAISAKELDRYGMRADSRPLQLP